MLHVLVLAAALFSVPLGLFGHLKLPEATPSLAIADEIRESVHATRAAASARGDDLAISFSIPLPIEHAELGARYAVMKAADDARAASLEDPELRLPARVIIPSIGLDVPIQEVGINKKGEMDVPESASGAAGWYARGTVPGDTGSAVLAAHVFAAFSALSSVPHGSDIYIETKGGVKLRFVADELRTFRLGDLSPQLLFERSDARRLNLITCAGTLTSDGSTYTHRFVIFATYRGVV